MKREPTSPAHPSELMVDTRSLAREAYDQLKRLILSGVFKGGEKIPEEKIAGILKVSRTPIREALRQLEQYGLVEIKPRSYVRVASVTAREADEIAAVRIDLESFVIKTLLTHPDRIQLAPLRDIADRAVKQQEYGNVAEAYLLDSAFHLELARQGGNATLLGILERLDAKNQLVRLRAQMTIETYRKFLLEHHAIIGLLDAGDGRGLLALLATHITPRV